MVKREGGDSLRWVAGPEGPARLSGNGRLWFLYLQRFVEKCGQLRFGHGAHLGGRRFTVLEEHQCRDAANAEFGSGIGIVVDIELGDCNTTLISLGDFVEYGSDHFARTAPLRPVV